MEKMSILDAILENIKTPSKEMIELVHKREALKGEIKKGNHRVIRDFVKEFNPKKGLHNPNLLLEIAVESIKEGNTEGVAKVVKGLIYRSLTEFIDHILEILTFNLILNKDPHILRVFEEVLENKERETTILRGYHITKDDPAHKLVVFLIKFQVEWGLAKKDAFLLLQPKEGFAAEAKVLFYRLFIQRRWVRIFSK